MSSIERLPQISYSFFPNFELYFILYSFKFNWVHVYFIYRRDAYCTVSAFLICRSLYGIQKRKSRHAPLSMNRKLMKKKSPAHVVSRQLPFVYSAEKCPTVNPIRAHTTKLNASARCRQQSRICTHADCIRTHREALLHHIQ